MSTALSCDYETLWTTDWGDLQRYGPVSRHQRRILRSLMDRIAVPPRTILDAGCGNGANLAFAHTVFPHAALAGVDISEEAVRQARHAGISARWFVGDPVHLVAQQALPPADLVTCIDVIEHIENDVTFLKALRHVTRHDLLLVTVQGTMRPSERAIGHVRNYKRGELALKLRQAGFHVVRVLEWGWPLYSPLFRTFVEATGTTSISMGRYGPGKRLLCAVLYHLFRLNSHRRGDKIFVHACPA